MQWQMVAATGRMHSPGRCQGKQTKYECFPLRPNPTCAAPGRWCPHSGWVFPRQLTWWGKSLMGVLYGLPLSCLRIQSSWQRRLDITLHLALFRYIWRQCLARYPSLASGCLYSQGCPVIPSESLYLSPQDAGIIEVCYQAYIKYFSLLWKHFHKKIYEKSFILN